MDIKEFREKGFLQEANRQFFHPLGLALEVEVDNDGNEKLGGIWDYREDPEGMIFGENMIQTDKMEYVEGLRKEKAITRQNELGYIIQPK